MSNHEPAAGKSGVNPDALLSRELGVRQLGANIFNYTVGSGIFLLPATAVVTLGTAAPLAYVACAIVIGLVVLCFAESGSRVSATGGAYAYVETALGPLAGFVAGCLVFTTGMFAASAVFTGFVRSLLAFFNTTASGWITNALIVGVIAVLVAINMRGVRNGARLLEIITVAKLLPLLLFVGIGAFFIEPANLAWTSVPSSSQVLGAAGIVIFAFSGIEGATIPSGEVKNTSRTVPRAILLALGTATLLYLGDSVRRPRHHGHWSCRHGPHAARRGRGRGARSRRAQHHDRCSRRVDVRLPQRQRVVRTTRAVRNEP